jgi:hypothetical protein
MSQSSAHSSNNTDSKDEVDAIATVNEIIFLIVVGIVYIAAEIGWLRTNIIVKYPTY